MKIKVLHITNSLNIGGLETLLLSLLKQIDREAFVPCVCTLTPSSSLIPEFEEQGIKVFTITKKKGINVKLFFRLIILLRKEKIQIIHTHNFGAWFYGAVAGFFCNVAVVNTEHSNVPESNRRQLWGEKFLAGLSKKIICDSYSVLNFMATKQKIAPSKLKMILNGVDCNLFGIIAPNESIKHELGILPNQVAIGIVARLVPVKNHIGLLKGINLIRRNTTKFKLFIVGDGECRPDLEQFVKDNGLEKQVSFLGNRRDIPEIMAIIDIFVLNSFSEGLPITILEAMASRKPVIATNVGGNREILGHNGEAGILVKSDCPEELAETMLSLIKDASLRERLGDNARKRVEENASLVAMVRKYENIYRNCKK